MAVGDFRVQGMRRLYASSDRVADLDDRDGLLCDGVACVGALVRPHVVDAGRDDQPGDVRIGHSIGLQETGSL